MPYVPVNVAAYTASYAGAIAGMAVSGWITNPTQADYTNVTLIAGAFAQSFDTVWNNATQLNNLEIEAITAVVQQDFSGRGPGPFNNLQFQNPNNWNVAAAACAALILESDIFFASQGINPGTPGGGGGGIPAPAISQQVYVSGVYGSNVTGDGTQGKPYATVSFAYSTILDASPTKTYEIIVLPSTYIENIVLKPFIIMTGSDDTQTTGGFLPTRISGNFTLDATFGGPQIGQVTWVTNIDIDGLLTLDFAALTATTSSAYFTNCQCEANILITAASTSNDIEFHDCITFGDFTIAGGFIILVNTNGINDTALLTCQCTALASISLRAFGGSWAGSVTMDQNGEESNCILNSEGFSLSRGNVQMLATALTSPAIVANYGDTPENVNLSGAAAELSAQMRISHQFPDIAPNPTAIAGMAAGPPAGPPFAAVTTISLIVPANLIGVSDIEGMQCSCSPVGANWGTFIGPHNCSVTFTYRNNGGVPNVDVNISNPGAAFNITDPINLNFSAYVPGAL